MLTEKQVEAILRIANGDTEREAAAHLGLTYNTYRDRVRKAKAKLGAKTATHMVALAIKHGAISRKDIT